MLVIAEIGVTTDGQYGESKRGWGDVIEGADVNIVSWYSTMWLEQNAAKILINENFHIS